jgi:hypothetical protein
MYNHAELEVIKRKLEPLSHILITPPEKLAYTTATPKL